MSFWQWFKTDGDKVFTFVSLVSLALTGEPSIDPHVAKLAVIAGLVATAAHQSFFPTGVQK